MLRRYSSTSHNGGGTVLAVAIFRHTIVVGGAHSCTARSASARAVSLSASRSVWVSGAKLALKSTRMVAKLGRSAVSRPTPCGRGSVLLVQLASAKSRGSNDAFVVLIGVGARLRLLRRVVL